MSASEADSIPEGFTSGVDMPGCCEICTNINLKTSISGQDEGEMGATLIAELGPLIARWMSNDCPMCEFFASMVLMAKTSVWSQRNLASKVSKGETSVIVKGRRDEEEKGWPSEGVMVLEEDLNQIVKQEYTLRSFSGYGFLQHRVPGLKYEVQRLCNPLLGVVDSRPPRQSRPFFWTAADFNHVTSSGYICPGLGSTISDKKAIQTRLVNSERIDFNIVKNWLKLCFELHADICGVEQNRSIEYFRLIDCQTRMVSIPPTSDGGILVPEYLALSYVWGPPTPGDSLDETSGVLKNIPRTIEDAIEVTLGLGFRYLWVDRYCIYQNDLRRKMAQINCMDLVYKRASATIIAACDNISLGLPGAGHTPRIRQPTLGAGSSLLLSTLPDPVSEIKGSVWMTRGWTFQEALLSRRRIFFTRHQVYFECSVVSCCESISETEEMLNLMKGEPGLDFSSVQRVFPHERVSQKMKNQSWTILNYISDYTARSLTYESDILNGIISLFNSYGQDTGSHHHQVTNLWGVPVLTSKSFPWTPIDGFINGLCWESQIGGVARRKGFPSWSWTGWTGTVRGNHEHYTRYYERGFKLPYEIDVAVEVSDGSVYDWITYENLPPAVRYPPELSPFIHLEAWAVECHIEITRQDFSDNIKCILGINSENVDYYFSMDLTEQVQLGSELHLRLQASTLEAIIIGNVESPTSSAKIPGQGPLLLVVECQVDTAQRVGLVNCRDYVSNSSHENWQAEYANWNAMRREQDVTSSIFDIAPVFLNRRRKNFRLC